jgi:hypothetical protein
VQTSFQPPHVLATRISTSESFGILPLAQKLAEAYSIQTLPNRRISGIPHHNDVPLHALTRLSTKPTNRYRYLQTRQLTLFPVTPVHTLSEYKLFKEIIYDDCFRRGGAQNKVYSAQDAYKMINWDKVAVFWNIRVATQSRVETDSNQRLYYKVPPQLERHYKHMLAYSTERTTLAMGSNAIALKGLQCLLRLQDCDSDPSRVVDAIPLPDLPKGVKDSCYRRLEGA